MDNSCSSREASSCDIILVGPNKIPVHRDDWDLIEIILATNEIAAEIYREKQIERQPRIPLRRNVQGV